MAGPSTVSLRIPAYTNPAQFGADVVDLGSDPDSLEVLVLENAFEEAGLGDLAIALGVLRGAVEPTPGSALSRENLPTTIAEIATRDGKTIQRVLVEIQEGAASGVSRFGDGAQLRAELLRRLRERYQEVETGASLLDFETDPSAAPAPFSFSVSAVDDEERVAGFVWQSLYLPQVLLEAVKVKGHPIELALDALEDRSQPVAVKVMALRVLGSNVETITTLQGFLKVVGAVVNTFEQANDLRLKEMALAVLRKFDFSEGARFPLSPPLADQVGRAKGGDLTGTSHFEPGLRTWESAHPPWYAILNEYLGIDVAFSKEVKLQQARAIFSNETRPDHQRALALAYYSYLFSPKPGFHLSRTEADTAAQSLLKIIQNNLPNGQLSHMGAVVYARIVVDQVNAAAPCFHNDQEESRRTLEWATARSAELDRVLPPSAVTQRRSLESIQAIIRHLDQPLSDRKPVGQRFGEWVDGLFR